MGRNRFILIILSLLTGAVPHDAADRPAHAVAVDEPSLTSDALITRDVKLPVRQWPAKIKPVAVIVAVHGLNDYSNAFTMPAQAFATAGITTYAYDQRGFGLNPNRGIWHGTKQMSDDLKAMVTAVRIRHPRLPIYILGESMGAAITMVTMSRDDAPPVNGLILSAPAVGQEIPPEQQAIIWLGEHVVPGLTIGRVRGIPPATDNKQVLRALRDDPYVPRATRVDTLIEVAQLMANASDSARRLKGRVLVLYGRRDRHISASQIYTAVNVMQSSERMDVTFRLYDDGYHLLLRDLQAQAVIKDIINWVAGRPLPSMHP
jgi:alpha-beta hydrolase superfamily lysophospholipase